MKPLVYYCRWQSASLRLRGRDQTAVWGHLVYLDDENNETLQEFHFDLKYRVITLINGEEKEVKQLDDMGVVVEESP